MYALVYNISNRTSATDDRNPGDEQPDAVISVTNGASFKRTIAYGEVKPEAQALNHNLVNKDLVRIGRLAKGAIDSNNTKLSFSFLVVGKYAINIFYITQYLIFILFFNVYDT